jgi:hypothetical protein
MLRLLLDDTSKSRPVKRREHKSQSYQNKENTCNSSYNPSIYSSGAELAQVYGHAGIKLADLNSVLGELDRESRIRITEETMEKIKGQFALLHYLTL